jgi:hypothetical protein
MKPLAFLLLCAALLAVSPVPVFAQDTKQASPTAATPGDLDALRDAMRHDRRGLVERNLQLTTEEAKRFWPVYDAYLRELEVIVKRHNRAVLDYVNTESTMTDGNARRIAREVLAADIDESKLRERMFRKVLGVLPPRKAVRYLQIENKIDTIERYDVAERIALVR